MLTRRGTLGLFALALFAVAGGTWWSTRGERSAPLASPPRADRGDAPVGRDRDLVPPTPPAPAEVAAADPNTPGAPGTDREGAPGTSTGARTEAAPADDAPGSATRGAVPYAPRPLLDPRPAEPGQVTGWVVDENGVPVDTHLQLALVYGRGGGSRTVSGNELAAFDLSHEGFQSFVLKAETLDGRVALTSFEKEARDQAIGDVVLRLQPGATVELRLSGAREKVRCALFTDNLRHADFTLVRGRRPRIVAPVGMLHVQLYEGEVVHAERFVRLRAGQEELMSFQLDS